MLNQSNDPSLNTVRQIPLEATQQTNRPLTQRDALLNKNLMSQYEKRTVKDFDPHHFNMLFAGANTTKNQTQVLPSLTQRAVTHRASQKPSNKQPKAEGPNRGLLSERSKYFSSSTVNQEK